MTRCYQCDEMFTLENDVSGARCLIHHCERQTDVDASNVPTACDLGCIAVNDDGFISERQLNG